MGMHRAGRNRLAMLGVAIAGSMVSGCVTTSFAPPKVQTGRTIEAGRVFTCDQLDLSGDRKINPDVDGSINLINNYIRAYRCAAHEAADGRQIFEVPSMLALLVAGVGPSLGLSPDAALAATAGSAFYARGNSYYAPKEKAAVLDSALDAVLCAKAAAVGFDFFDTSVSAPSQSLARQEAQEFVAKGLQSKFEQQAKAEADLRVAAEKVRSSGASLNSIGAEGFKALQQLQQQDQPDTSLPRLDSAVASMAKARAQTGDALRKVEIELAQLRSHFEAPRVHYEMVSTALLSIERVLATRFSNIGSFDSAGIAAEFAQLGKKEEETGERKKDVDAGKAKDSSGQPLTRDNPEFQGEKDKTELQLLQTKLQICVVRAKV